MIISTRITEQHPGRPLRALALAAGLVALGVAGVASAQINSIEGSKHDFTAGGQAQDVTNGGANPLPAGTGICVFCHTPHGSDTSASVPLWNKTLPDPATYTRYSNLGTVTLDGSETDVGSVSLACLSCHDGSQAMDAVINVPGAGLNTGNIAGGVSMAGTPVPNLTTDLQDDHPISIQYAGGGCADGGTGTPTCGTFGDADFAVPTSDVVNGTAIWWLEVGTADVGGAALAANDPATRGKHDLLLYTRPAAAGGGATGNEPFVECGSCHDPHNDGTAPVSFLRVDNSGSQVCLACHNK